MFHNDKDSKNKMKIIVLSIALILIVVNILNTIRINNIPDRIGVTEEDKEEFKKIEFIRN